jgi:hypothetical protein
MLLPGLIQGHHSTIHDDFLIEILGSIKKKKQLLTQSHYNFPVLGIWDVYVGSRILISSISGSRGSQIQQKKRTEKTKLLLSSQIKLIGSIQDLKPGIWKTYPGSRGQKSTGSRFCKNNCDLLTFCRFCGLQLLGTCPSPQQNCRIHL